MDDENEIMRNAMVFTLCCTLLVPSTFVLALQNDADSPPEQSVIIAQEQLLYDRPNGRSVSYPSGTLVRYEYGAPVFVRESRDNWSLVTYKAPYREVEQGDRGWVPNSSLANPAGYYRLTPPRQVRILVEANSEDSAPMAFFLNADGHCTGDVSDVEADSVIQALQKAGIQVHRSAIGCATMWGVPHQRFVLVKVLRPYNDSSEELPTVYFVHSDGHLCGTQTSFFTMFYFVDADGKLVSKWPECEGIGKAPH